MLGRHETVQLIDGKGLRVDGRGLYELRPIKMEVGVLDKANGSAYIEHGKNKILAGCLRTKGGTSKAYCSGRPGGCKMPVPYGAILS